VPIAFQILEARQDLSGRVYLLHFCLVLFLGPDDLNDFLSRSLGYHLNRFGSASRTNRIQVNDFVIGICV
jgi:hypothetical protein